jgi:glutamate/tyrosine decarboxylase-like PLP-dependent enzyme
MSDLRQLMTDVAVHVADFRAGLVDRATFPVDLDREAVRRALGSLPEGGTDPAVVIDELVAAVDPALVASAGPRFFGFVVGGALDAATAAEMLATGWDQVSFNAVTSPAAALVEETAGAWLKELLGLPPAVSFGFVTGAQGANTVALAAARHHVLARAGWDVEADGLVGAPLVRVVANGERHATIDRSLRLLGLGANAIEPVATDDQGRIDVVDLGRVLAATPAGPTIVSLQAGNVNTGAIDDLGVATAIAHEHGAWVHVDGAFGLWAAASPAKRPLVDGIETADSWGTDGHKWLNVPYDCGYVFCADAEAHAASMAYTAAYLTGQGGAERSPADYVMESSRHARGFATWAALRQLGRSGVAELVDRCCALATRFADQLAAIAGVTIANDVVLNQVLVDFGDEQTTDAVVDAVQRSGECWMGATTWHGRRLMRISVSNWSTTEADVDRSVAAIVAAYSSVSAASAP